MEHADQRPPGTEPPGDRLSRLSRASLRINESLDVDNALQAVMDSARSLTDAPYAAIITLDASGAVEDHLVLGFDPGDVERLWQAPQGQVFFEYLNALPGPLRVGCLEEFTASIGLGEFRSPVQLTAFMAAPILRQGVRSGHIYVGHGEPGRAFGREDEETLVMFASQAALVVANARCYRDEQRARAGLDRDPRRHVAGGCRRLRHAHGGRGLLQPGGPQDCRRPARPRLGAGGPVGVPDGAPRRRQRGLPAGVSPGARPGLGRDGAGRVPGHGEPRAAHAAGSDPACRASLGASRAARTRAARRR